MEWVEHKHRYIGGVLYRDLTLYINNGIMFQVIHYHSRYYRKETVMVTSKQKKRQESQPKSQGRTATIAKAGRRSKSGGKKLGQLARERKAERQGLQRVIAQHESEQETINCEIQSLQGEQYDVRSSCRWHALMGQIEALWDRRESSFIDLQHRRSMLRSLGARG